MKSKIFLLLALLLGTGSVFCQQPRKSVPCATFESQAAMNICAGKEYKSADASLNRMYQQLAALLGDEAKAQLKEAEMAWIKYRDAHCEFVADEYKGGSIRPTILGLCLADVTRNRTTELKAQIKERNN